MRSVLQIIENPDNACERIAVHVKCSNAPKGQSIVYTIGDRGGVQWIGFSPMTADDLTAIVKRKEKGIPLRKRAACAGVQPACHGQARRRVLALCGSQERRRKNFGVPAVLFYGRPETKTGQRFFKGNTGEGRPNYHLWVQNLTVSVE